MPQVITEIIDFIFGKRYFANIINTRGTDRCEISCFIFKNRAEANAHRDKLSDNRTYRYVTTVSFRSRHQL